MDALRAAGWTNYSLFLCQDGLLIGYVETESFETATRSMEATDVDTRWQAQMAPLFTQELAFERLDEVSTLTEFAAIDLGASSGRVGLGRLADGLMILDELHRFSNCLARLPDGLRWNLLQRFAEATGALRGRSLDGVGADTWSVDYAPLDDRGRVLGLPFHYRDARTDGMVDRLHGRVPQPECYAVSGIQTMPINTVFQLLAEEGSAGLDQAHAIALVPDLLARWLCGELANERTNASTTALLDARSGEWSHDLIRRLGLPSRPFGELVEPGTSLGPRARASGDRCPRVYGRQP